MALQRTARRFLFNHAANLQAYTLQKQQRIHAKSNVERSNKRKCVDMGCACIILCINTTTTLQIQFFDASVLAKTHIPHAGGFRCLHKSNSLLIHTKYFTSHACCQLDMCLPTTFLVLPATRLQDALAVLPCIIPGHMHKQPNLSRNLTFVWKNVSFLRLLPCRTQVVH